MTDRTRDTAGFSLIELLVVTLIVGALLTFTLPAIRRYTATASLLGGTEQVTNAMRVARFKAVAEHNNVIVRFQWANRTYTLHSDTDQDGVVDASERVRGPYTIPQSIAWTNSATLPIAGDSLVFRPNGTLLAGGSLSLTGHGTKTITVLASTGGVWVQ